EALDRLQGLVDHHPVGHVDAVAQLVGGNPQHRALDRIDFADGTVEEGFQGRVKVAAMGLHPAHQVFEILEVGDFVRLLVRELGDRVARVHARQLHRVHRLQGAPARARTPDRVDAGVAATRTSATLRPHGSTSSRLAISSATRAHSSPLLPWLPPARFSASTMSSTASTPLATGTPWSSWTRARPSAQAAATCSKWRVSPRTTQPRATTAAWRPSRARRAASIGISQAPGTRMTSTASAATPLPSKVARAAVTSASTMRGFQRLAMIAKRAPSGACRSPS